MPLTTTVSCPHDPSQRTGPTGMYHCPDCGCMVLAGRPHGACWAEFDDECPYARPMTTDEKAELERVMSRHA